MSVSDRAAHAIDPKASDLLMPERWMRSRQPRMRDIEDASFETVARGRMQRAGTRKGPQPRPVFQSRLTDFPNADPFVGPFPRDFATSQPTSVPRVEPGERLGVFAGGKSAMSSSQPSAATAFAMMVGAIVLAVFWMAGGHALVLTASSDLQALTAAPPPTSVADVETADVLVPDPVVTSSVLAEAGPTDSGSIIHAKPRPARIERAGSILMIRPEGR
ncbi:hypothetical protein [Hoeflea sp.]|uniref:hypothetical protein n=1 Tax=Hoeflea sp. TaxID=1940281 RepID=UPI00374996F9